MPSTKDVLEFLGEVLSHWAVLATGGVVMALAWFRSSVQNRPVPVWANRWLARMFLACAVFLAWKGQRDSSLILKGTIRELEAKLTSPGFSGRLEAATFGNAGDRGQNAGIYVWAAIRNPHGPASAIDSWKLQVRLPDGKVLQSYSPYLPAEDMRVPINGGADHIIAKLSDYLPLKTKHPLPAGDIVEGWIWGVFDNTDPRFLSSSRGSIVLRFTDAIEGREHIVEGPIGADVPRRMLPSSLLPGRKQ